MSLAIGLTVIFFIVWLSRVARSKSTKKMVDDTNRLVSEDDIQKLIRQDGKTIVVFEGNVCEVPRDFKHPGGMEVIRQYNGKEVGGILRGTSPGMVKGRNKYVPHSDYALRMLMKMKIGVMRVGEVTAIGGRDIELGKVISSTSSRDRIVGKIQSNDQINTCPEHPVRLFRIYVENLQALNGHGSIEPGARMYMSLKEGGIERPYTIVSYDTDSRVICFAIKIYPTGEFTSQLGKVRVGGKVLLGHVVVHSSVPCIPAPPGMIVMIAGGTGVVPMLSYIKDCGKYALGGVLMWWVHGMKDLFMLDILDSNCEKYGVKIKVFFTSESGDTDDQTVVVGGSIRKESITRKREYLKKPLFGRISSANILEGLGGFLPIDPRDIGIVMSGPVGFIDSSHKAVGELGIPQERVLCLD
jgi:ferredoxin-NADP reductase